MRDLCRAALLEKAKAILNRIRDGLKNREGVVRKMLLAFVPFAHLIA